jgi:hypothetical protein
LATDTSATEQTLDVLGVGSKGTKGPDPCKSKNCRLKIAASQATTERLAVVLPVWR